MRRPEVWIDYRFRYPSNSSPLVPAPQIRHTKKDGGKTLACLEVVEAHTAEAGQDLEAMAKDLETASGEEAEADLRTA